ncbi:Uncharacterised protein [Phocoenobacter uteri]|uniref:V8-like Glu-specific endopeptidase n=1 Tax=Phocoenobacter uteri TaxID=146806 RepID=A0A379C8W6_9PAST|nr:serine protease [Phocoenobacter uteri]MDG6882410.1 zinc chelation protein SecC [Phocoenobacter uteri]SUB58568.1 Uncharacterised protein [Phocoenobacter uteri]
MNLSISEKLTYSTVRIECELKDRSLSTGTGFFFNFQENDDESFIPVLITNRHVIKDALKGRFTITKSDEKNNPLDEEHLTVELGSFESKWILHPDENVDLCAMLIAPLIHQLKDKQEYLFFIPLTKELLPTTEQLKEFTALEEVLMIGYPNGIWDFINNKPILRKGSTATHPVLDYNGNKEIMIDIAAFPGSSGSPVLIVNENSYRDRSGSLYLGKSRIILLGILYAGPQFTVTGDIEMSSTLNRPMAVSRIPNNLGLIIKSERILELEETVFEYIRTKI